MTYDPFAQIAPPFLRNSRPGDCVSDNERQVLRHCFRMRDISRAELLARLDLTQQSLHRIVEQLKARKVLDLGPMKPPTGRGQPSPTLVLNPDYAFTIGISINTDNAGVSLMDFAGGYSATTLLIDGLSMDKALARIEEAANSLMDERGLHRDKLMGVGFGIAGYLVTGTSFNAPLPLHEWSLIELGPLISARFNAPVWTENGANTAALCEALFGVGRYISNFAYLSFNYGFGGAVINNGELLRGGHGNAGEFSGIYDDEENPRRPALKHLLDILQQNRIPVTTIEDLHKRFDPNWPGVSDWVEIAKGPYNRLVNALCAIVDPQAIVFGGQIPPRLADMFIEETNFYWHRRARYGVPRRMAKLIVSEQTSDPSAIGAAALPLKACFF